MKANKNKGSNNLFFLALHSGLSPHVEQQIYREIYDYMFTNFSKHKKKFLFSIYFMPREFLLKVYFLYKSINELKDDIDQIIKQILIKHKIDVNRIYNNSTNSSQPCTIQVSTNQKASDLHKSTIDMCIEPDLNNDIETMHNSTQDINITYDYIADVETIEDLYEYIHDLEIKYLTIYATEDYKIKIWAIDKIQRKLNAFYTKNKLQALEEILRNPLKYSFEFPINWNQENDNKQGRKRPQKGFGIGYMILGQIIIEYKKTGFKGYTEDKYFDFYSNIYLKSNVKIKFKHLSDFSPKVVKGRVETILKHLYPSEEYSPPNYTDIIEFKNSYKPILKLPPDHIKVIDKMNSMQL